MNGKNGCFALHFCTETEQCERVASMQQKRIKTKTEQCERGLNIEKSAKKLFTRGREEDMKTVIELVRDSKKLSAHSISASFKKEIFSIGPKLRL